MPLIDTLLKYVAIKKNDTENTRIKTGVLFIGIFFLSGCANDFFTSLNGPNGKPALLIRCALIEKCYEKASEMCQNEYTIINTAHELFGQSANMQPYYTTNLFIQCKKEQTQESAKK
jgi:hypothetical protein